MSSKSYKYCFILVLVTLTIIGCAPKTVIKPELVFPPAPEKPRLKFIRSFSGKKDFVGGKFDKLKETLAGSESSERIIKPYGVAVDDSGLIYVTDAGNRCVLVFNENPTGSRDVLTYLGNTGTGQLSEPAGIAIDDKGNIFVSDVRLNVVNEYNSKYEYVRILGTKKTFVRPAGLAFNPKTREVVVVDTKDNNLKFFNESGSLVRTVGTRGTDKGQFNLPSNIACDSHGKIYVVDEMNFRVQIFDSTGKFLSTFGQADNVPGSFSRPKGIALDSEGNIYVADASFDNVQIFQTDGTLLLYFGSVGRGDGEFQLPAGLCFDKKDRLYVADQYNQRIQVFQYIKY